MDHEQGRLDKENYSSGSISWMARNPVASNLLMIIFIVGGLLFMTRVKQEVFPEFDLDIVNVSVLYPGASPAEVEQGILLAIEDEVRGLDGVKQVKSTALEGRGVVRVELLLGENRNKLLQDVKNVVDGITSFPEEAERPIVSLLETRRQVISLILYGDQNQQTLRAMAEKVRDDLLAGGKVTLVELGAVKPLEIAVEIPERTLREYNLTLEHVSQLIKDTALELPGGGVKTSGGEVLLRTQERRDYAREFGDIEILAQPDGSRVYLRDIAHLWDTFEDVDIEAFFNGIPAVRVDVYRVGDQTPIQIAGIVQDYVEELRQTLPDSMQVATWNDRSEIFRDRIQLLVRNAALGLVLVFMILGLFLEPRLAFWVMLGIPISIIGSFLFIPLTGASINMVSLFAFIVTLGIIVDDAVVVGEMVYQKREHGMSFLRAAIEGARAIAGPVTFAVLTNIAAFIPLFLVPGSTGKIFFQIPAITVAVFAISLVESLYVLPSHLAHSQKESRFWQAINKPQRMFNRSLKRFIHGVYVPSAKLAFRYRYLTISCGLCLLALAVSLVIGGRIQFSYLPKVDSDLVTAQATLPFGVAIEEARRVQRELVRGAQETLKQTGGDKISRGIYTQIGEIIPGGGPTQEGAVPVEGSHQVGAQLFLVPADQRTISGLEFAQRWREQVGMPAGVDVLQFDATIGAQGGSVLAIELSHTVTEIAEQAARELTEVIRTYAGAQDIDSGVDVGKPQYNFTLKPEGRALGLTVHDLAQQVRSAFYGSEALRQQRGRNEVKVLVRLPKEERERINTVEELILRSPTGGEIPLSEASDVSRGRAYTAIRRTDGRRVVTVTGDVNESEGNANEIIASLEEQVLPELLVKYPGLTYTLEGQQREQAESLEALGVGYLAALLAIFALMAIPFKSYAQPLIVMLSIPFGILGAIIGHLLLGYEISIISMFGIIALSGVVVNDSLVLIVKTNENHFGAGLRPYKSVLYAAVRRFRPIMLTSLTTFLGLAPMIFETSMQARFLVPMAISLGFGILFATLIVLIIVPTVYLMIEDARFWIQSHRMNEK